MEFSAFPPHRHGQNARHTWHFAAAPKRSPRSSNEDDCRPAWIGPFRESPQSFPAPIGGGHLFRFFLGGCSATAVRMQDREVRSRGAGWMERAGMPQADLVLEGGGVKGLGTVAAVIRLLERGYRFPRIAGTSAGAMVGALAAAGADAARIRNILGRLDLSRIPDRRRPGLPVISEGLALLTRSGAYAGDYLRDWLDRELRALGATTFGDLRRDEDADGDDASLRPDQRYKLVVLVTDITHGRLLRLPWDYHLLHLDPDAQSVAEAVRMSMSLPLFFEPQRLTDPVSGEVSLIVDGAVLSNFAVEIFDRTDGVQPRWPTFGIRLLPDLPKGIGEVLPGLGLPLPPPFEVLKKVLITAVVGHDQTQLSRPKVRDRMITVDTSDVGITEFDIAAAEREMLIRNGRDAVDRFLAARSAQVLRTSHPAKLNGQPRPKIPTD
jgi:predicted acylesterase/phospholipase RssA